MVANREEDPSEVRSVSTPDRETDQHDYRAAFYSQYHRAVNMPPTVPTPQQLRRAVQQFGGRWDHWLPLDRSASCLDLGCGTGEFLYYLRQRGFRNVTGVDLNPEELAVARTLGIEQVLCRDAIDHIKSLPSASCDLISAFNFFEHLTKIEILGILPAIRAALRPGGVLLAVTPNGLSPFSGTTRYWDFSHETGFTPASWRQLARLGGFSEAKFEGYGPLPHSALGVVRTVAWNAIALGLLAVSYIEVGGPRDSSKVFTADMKIILRR